MRSSRTSIRVFSYTLTQIAELTALFWFIRGSFKMEKLKLYQKIFSTSIWQQNTKNYFWKISKTLGADIDDKTVKLSMLNPQFMSTFDFILFFQFHSFIS